MNKLILLIVALCMLAGCGNESVNEAKPSPGGVSYSSSPEIDPFVDSSDSAEPVASSSSEVVIEKSSSSLQVSSSAEESSSSEDTEWSSSSMSQGCTGPACYLYSSSSSSRITIVCDEMVDERDGQTYRTVTIGGEVTWMAKNLNYAYLQPTADLDSSSRCLGNWSTGCDEYGRLYLWSAMMDSAAIFSDKTRGCGYYETADEWVKCDSKGNIRGVCPEGWRLPTYSDYRKLIPARTSIGMFWACDDVFFEENEICDDVFCEEQLRIKETVFWLAEEENFAYGIVDNYGYRVVLESEVRDLINASKKEYYAVRCVKDEEL